MLAGRLSRLAWHCECGGGRQNVPSRHMQLAAECKMRGQSGQVHVNWEADGEEQAPLHIWWSSSLRSATVLVVQCTVMVAKYYMLQGISAMKMEENVHTNTRTCTLNEWCHIYTYKRLRGCEQHSQSRSLTLPVRSINSNDTLMDCPPGIKLKCTEGNVSPVQVLYIKIQSPFCASLERGSVSNWCLFIV